VDKDKVIVTLTEDVKFEMEMVVESGRGYMPLRSGLPRLTDTNRKSAG